MPLDLNRRDFMEKIAVGTAALAVIGDLALAAAPGADDAVRLTPPKELPENAYPRTPPRVYKGAHLEAVAMPIGGIGTGSIWLDGQGRLSVWQIFNNLNETRVPDSFFAVRARVAGAGPKGSPGEPVTRVLQTVAEPGLKPVESLEYEGGYPIARLKFHDSALPVQIVLEALNPMIPLDAANSSIPCALFRLTATNSSKSDADVTLFASLQNAIGSGGSGDIKGVRLAGYGGNSNRVIRDKRFTGVAMSKSPDPVPTGPVKVRDDHGREVPGAEMFWIAGLQRSQRRYGGDHQPSRDQWRRAAGRRRVEELFRHACGIAGKTPRFQLSRDRLRGFREQDLRRLDSYRNRLRQRSLAWHRSQTSSRSAVSQAAASSTHTSATTRHKGPPHLSRSRSSGVISAFSSAVVITQIKPASISASEARLSVQRRERIKKRWSRRAGMSPISRAKTP